jgi:CTP synthase
MSKFVFGSRRRGFQYQQVSASCELRIGDRDYSVPRFEIDLINVGPVLSARFLLGEVFVDGRWLETDLDLGHYGRFTDTSMSRLNSVTAGSIYQAVINKERRRVSKCNLSDSITNEIKGGFTKSPKILNTMSRNY